ncbi:MAG: hypothetical protein IJ646_09105 [Clostridia bacterium]|nr:hypothetical protein [Clostridia bacterium]
MRPVRLFVAALAAILALCLASALGESESVSFEENIIHNYILVVDNGDSAADPDGLRYDAARLAYENVLTNNGLEGVGGQIGVVMYCGPDACVSYGPIDIEADRADIDAAVGDHLTADANAATRDPSTDIAAALSRARAMMETFDDPAATSVLLIADGPNDLPENNARALESARSIHETGASFGVAALQNDDEAYLSFMNDLAAAGGTNNIMTLSASDLDAGVVELLVRSESDAETVQALAGTAPLEASFTIPYSGLANATVNLAFLPEDKLLINAVSLVSPGGARYDLWNPAGAATEAAGIGVAEGRSYIMLDLPTPEPGDWTLIIDGDAPVAAAVRLNHNMRLDMSMRRWVDRDDTAHAEVWFQKYAGGGYADLLDSAIYDQSEAALMLFDPDNSTDEPTETLPMTLGENGRFEVSFTAGRVGIWTAKVLVKNANMAELLDCIAFEVVEPLAPTPTPLPPVADIEGIEIDIDGLLTDDAGDRFIDGFAAEAATVTFAVDGETEAVEAELLADGEPVLTGIQSGDAIPRDQLEDGHDYALRVSAMPLNGGLVGAEPVVQALEFRLAPAVAEIADIAIDVQPRVESDEALYVDRDAEAVTLSWTVDGDIDRADGALLADGEALLTGIQSGDAIPRGQFVDGVAYVARVSAVPKNGTLVGAEPVTRELGFRLYPEAQPVAGLALTLPGATKTTKTGAQRFEGSIGQLVWTHDSGDVDHYVLDIRDSKGASVRSDTLPGSTTSYNVELPRNDDYAVTLTAVPRYAREGAENAVATLTIRPHIKNFFEKYWYFIAAGAAALLLLIGLIVLLARRGKRDTSTYVTGVLHVYCEELELDEALTFQDGRKKGKNAAGAAVKEGAPLTTHPDLAKYKGDTAHRLLAGVKVSMARAGGNGQVSGEKGGALHQPNSPVIGLTAMSPTGAKQTRYVGAYDPDVATLNLRGGDGDYAFVFWGAEKPRSFLTAAERPAEPEPAEEPVEETFTEPEPVEETPAAPEPVAETVNEPEPVAETFTEPEPIEEAPAEPVSEPVVEPEPEAEATSSVASAYADFLAQFEAEAQAMKDADDTPAGDTYENAFADAAADTFPAFDNDATSDVPSADDAPAGDTYENAFADDIADTFPAFDNDAASDAPSADDAPADDDADDDGGPSDDGPSSDDGSSSDDGGSSSDLASAYADFLAQFEAEAQAMKDADEPPAEE